MDMAILHGDGAIRMVNRLLPGRHHLGKIIGMNEGIDGLALQGMDGKTGDLFRCRADIALATVTIEDHQAIGGVFHQEVEPVLAFTQGKGGLPDFGDKTGNENVEQQRGNGDEEDALKDGKAGEGLGIGEEQPHGTVGE